MSRRAISLVCAVGLLAVFAGAAGVQADEQDELARTWAAARVYVPDASATGVRTITVDEIGTALSDSDAAPVGVILYAHGCDGLSAITDVSGRFLARADYLVVAPDGFARQNKPVSCDPATHRGGLHRPVLGWRQDEIRFAAERLAGIPALSALPRALMGHSEGAITAATISDLPVRARIVEGWTCHAGWAEYRGLNAPAGQPVLALVGENDPWFRSSVLKGDCGAFMETGGPSRSIVYRAPNYLNAKHWLSGDPDVQREILEFLETVLKTNGKDNAG